MNSDRSHTSDPLEDARGNLSLLRLLDLVLPIQMSSWSLRPEARAALYEAREPFVPSLLSPFDRIRGVCLSGNPARSRTRLSSITASSGDSDTPAAAARTQPSSSCRAAASNGAPGP